MSFNQIITDPSHVAPKFNFNTGVVENYVEEYNLATPPVPGDASSDWGFTEWGKQQYIDPTQLGANNVFGADGTYGAPQYSWNTSDMKSVISVTNGGAMGNIYDLYSANGTGVADGGACVFLNSRSFTSTPMNQVVNFTLDAKIAQATGTASDGTAGAENGFILHYTNGPTIYTLFLQFRMSDARGQPPMYSYGSGTTFGFDANYSTYHTLPDATDSGPLHYMTYNINAPLISAIDYVASRVTQSSSDIHDLSKWTLEGFYTGTEVETTGGNIGMGLDVANINISADPSQQFTAADAAASYAGVYHITTGVSGELVTPVEGGAVSVVSHGNDTISSGIADLTVEATGDHVTVTGGLGTTNISASRSVVFSAAQGDSTISAGGAALVEGSAGTLQVTAGQGTVVHCGSGNTTVSGSGAITVIGGTGLLNVTSGSAGGSFLQAGTGNATLIGGGPNDTLFGGSGSSTITGSARSLIVAGAGTRQIISGAYDTVFGAAGAQISGAPGALIVAGEGRETLNGGGDGNVMWTGGSDGDVVHAGTGNETVAGLGISGNDQMFAGSGNDVFYAGAGKDSLYGSTGQATFVLQNSDFVQQGSGAITVFGQNQDTIVGGASFGQGMTAVLAGDNNVVTLGSGPNSVWNAGLATVFHFDEKSAAHDIIANYDFAKDQMTFGGSSSGTSLVSQTASGAGVSLLLADGTTVDILHVTNYPPGF